MNKIPLQKILFLSVLTISIPTYGMHTVSDVMYEMGEEASYIIGAPIISVFQYMKTYTEFALFSSSPKMRALGIQKARNRRTSIKKNLKHKKKETIDAIYNDFNITKDQQEKFSEIIQQFKQAEKKWLTSDHENFNHDQDFPAEIMPILKKNDIQPNSMQLVVATENISINTHASARMMLPEISDDGKTLNLTRILESPRITIYPAFKNLTPLEFLCSFLATNSKKAKLIHETGHIKMHHNADYNLIAYLTGIDREKYRDNAHVQELNTIEEQEAELFSAIKDADHASILRLYRQFNAYPKTLHLTHFAQLSAIDDSHHLERHLKAGSIPVQKIDTLTVMKFNAPTRLS